MPREVIEYRAVGVERLRPCGSTYRNEGAWLEDRGEAEFELADLRADGYKPAFLERRTVTYGEPERVGEGSE